PSYSSSDSKGPSGRVVGNLADNSVRVLDWSLPSGYEQARRLPCLSFLQPGHPLGLLSSLLPELRLGVFRMVMLPPMTAPGESAKAILLDKVLSVRQITLFTTTLKSASAAELGSITPFVLATATTFPEIVIVFRVLPSQVSPGGLTTCFTLAVGMAPVNILKFVFKVATQGWSKQ